MEASMSTVGKRFYSLIAIFALSVAGLVTVTFPASASVVETLTFSPEQTSIIQTGTAASFKVIPDSEPVAGTGRMDWAPFATASLNASSLVDWLPDGGAWNKSWKVKNDVGTSNPRATLSYVTEPRFVWYLDLAQSSQVDMFLGGIDGSYKDRVIDIFGELVDDTGPSVEKINEFESDRLAKMRAKVNNLSISKMEFVARSFVEMESLGSFLVEFLPSVGGNIRTISMTR